MSTVDVGMPPSVVRLMAISYLEAGLLDEAERLLASPQRVDGWSDLLAHVGLARAEQGAIELALRHFQRVLQHDPAHPAARQASLDVLRHLAADRVDRQEWEAARELLTQALTLSPNDEQLRSSVAAVDEALPGALIHQQRYTEAVAIWERRQLENPTSVRLAHELALVYGRLASALERAGEISAADAAWRGCIGNWGLVAASDAFWSTWVPSREAVYGMAIPGDGAQQLRQRELQAGLEQVHRDFEAAYQERNDESDVKRHRDLRLRLRLEIKAADALRETLALATGSNHADAVPVAAGPLMLEHLGLLKTAREFADRIQAAHRNSEAPAALARALSAVGLAELLLEDGQPDRAIVEVDALLRETPTHVAARALKARALAQIGRRLAAAGNEQGATARWAEALDLDPKNEEAREQYAEAIAKQADALLQADDDRGAQRVLEQALRRVPGHTALTRKLAVALNNCGVTAMQAAVSLIKQNQADASGRKLNEAADLLKQALKLDPSNMTATRNLQEANDALAMLRKMRGY